MTYYLRKTKNTNVTSLKANNCLVEKEISHSKSDFHLLYANGSVVFRDSIFTCAPYDWWFATQKCLLHIEIKGIGNSLMLINSKLQGYTVFIDIEDGELVIDENSHVNSDAFVYLSTGSHSEFGASYGGIGGCCQDHLDHVDNTYGNYDEVLWRSDISNMDRKPNFMGSVGNSLFNGATQGGGTVVINAKTIQLSGNITANGNPLDIAYVGENRANGGSGGYILLNFTKLHDNSLQFGNKASIQAIGGLGVNDGASGSGGRIILNNFNPQNAEVYVNNIYAYGGEIMKGFDKTACNYGASGTIYFKSKDELYIKGKERKYEIKIDKVKYTPLGYKSNSTSISSRVKAIKSAHITIKDYASTSLDFTDLLLYDNSTFSEPYTDRQPKQYHLNGRLIIAENGSSLIFGVNSDTPIITLSQTLFISPTSSIKYDKEITIICKDRITLQGNLTAINFDVKPITSKLMTKIVSETKLYIDSNVIIHCHACILVGLEDIQFNGKIINDKDSCLGDSEFVNITKKMHCIDKNNPGQILSKQAILDNYNKTFPNNASTFEGVLDLIPNNYTTFLLTFKNLTLKTNSYIQGSRINICAQNITMEVFAKVNASHLGCPPNRGPGSYTKVVPHCGSPGACYGGYGGEPGLLNRQRGKKIIIASQFNETNLFRRRFRTIDDCSEKMCRLYGDDEEFIFEGSGGPSMNITANKGGHGGGLISFEVEQIFILQGNITAVGEKPTFNTTSGGGSGGSVQIITTKLIGNGTININGGNGTIRQSGGGGGGKASIFFRQSHNMSYYPSMTELWHGQIKRRGGHGYAETEREFNEDYDGYEGILFTTKCQAGYSGAFCEACDIGWYKTDYSYLPCTPCKNKPLENSNYDKTAWTTSDCSYKCEEGFDESSVNPDCLPPFELFIQNIGGWRIVVIATILSGILICSVACFLSHFIRIKRETRMDSEGDLKEAFLNESEQKNKRRVLTEVKLADIDLLYHVERIYCVGLNNPSNSWIIPMNPPIGLNNIINPLKFRTFALNYSDSGNWKSMEAGFSVMLSILFPPLGLIYFFWTQK